MTPLSSRVSGKIVISSTMKQLAFFPTDRARTVLLTKSIVNWICFFDTAGSGAVSKSLPTQYRYLLLSCVFSQSLGVKCRLKFLLLKMQRLSQVITIFSMWICCRREFCIFSKWLQSTRGEIKTSFSVDKKKKVRDYLFTFRTNLKILLPELHPFAASRWRRRSQSTPKIHRHRSQLCFDLHIMKINKTWKNMKYD